MAEYNYERVTVGHYEVAIDKKEQYGYFEHDELGDESGGGLWFVNNALEDYDGVYELPKDVIKGIEQLGFNADYAKDE